MHKNNVFKKNPTLPKMTATLHFLGHLDFNLLILSRKDIFNLHTFYQIFFKMRRFMAILNGQVKIFCIEKQNHKLFCNIE